MGGCAGEPKTRYADPNKWIEPGDSEPNNTEVLFFALLLVAAHRGHAQDLQCWAQSVLDIEGVRAAELGSNWKPLGSWGHANNMNKIWLPLHEAYVQASWPRELLP